MNAMQKTPPHCGCHATGRYRHTGMTKSYKDKVVSKTIKSAMADRRNHSLPFMWLDWFDYGQHVILHDRQIPWEEPPKLINFMQQGQSLLDLDVVGLPLDKYFSWWLAQHPDLLESMAGRKRVGFALKTFLANSALRQSLLELIRSASSALSVPVALMLPSPRQLLRWAHGTANNQEDTQVDEIMVDSAAVYLTGLLAHIL